MPPESTYVEPQTKKNIISKSQLEARCKAGEILIVVNQKVYKLDKWIKHHPGGQLAIRHCIGRDCTDEVKALHPDYVLEKKIKYFEIADYLPKDSDPEFAPILGNPASRSKEDIFAAQEALYSKAYRQLEIRLKNQQLFETNYINYAWRLSSTSGEPARCTTWHRLSISFFAHDAGHNSITHSLEIDNGIGIFLADFLGGLSIGWWKKSHYVHHIVTNHPIHDPDIQHLPFFAVTTRIFKGFFSTYHQKEFVFDRASQFFVSYQHYLYYPIMMLGRFNLYVQSMKFLATEPVYPYRKQEIIGLTIYWIWYPYFVKQLPTWNMVVAYIFISHMFTFMLHVQITLSHFGMSTEELGDAESFAAKMLRTTMDVDCPIWLDWFHGGLQFQAIHHLFPRMPRHNLRRAQPFVKEFCDEVGLTYHIHGFAKGNSIVYSALKDVADQVGFFVEVAKHEAKEYVDAQKIVLPDLKKDL
ncbi:hypothetical protein BGZ96_000084 [Linnemannia gamsii]|uniref:Cytochrome b5 heme-binding domain-containing protein n=1 Tax=Linnemannia gamsii TaxID=64522 RepID=A0ABQ7KGG1_9FUNG|nr:hypothetical protein BGZ96_000084 [Linnemannia gamsii]